MRSAKRWILYGLILLNVVISRAGNDVLRIDSIIDLINTESYRVHFDSLRSDSACSRKVITGVSQSSDHNACRDYIYRTFQTYLGPQNCYLNFFEEGSFGALSNVIGVKKGLHPEKGIWIVGAHYDSNNSNQSNLNNSEISPGANDNGTGVAAILEFARILGNLDTEATIVLAAWDMEEIFTDGYGTGSHNWLMEFVKKRKATQWGELGSGGLINIDDIRGNINFDMFGNPQLTNEGKPVLWACYAKDNQQHFTQKYAATINKYIPEIEAISYGRLIWSDHYTFASQKIPSVENLESNYLKDPYYHTFSDHLTNPENIDFEFATNVTRGGLAFLLEQVLVTKDKEWVFNQELLCKTESPACYHFQTTSPSAKIEIYSQYGELIFQENGKITFSFSPEMEGWYYIREISTGKINRQIVYLNKKEGLF